MSTTTAATPRVGRKTAATTAIRGELELKGIVKAYNTKRSDARAVDDFSLYIKPGQFVTLLGPSGCGKTTTLRMIAGFETPTKGDILIDGRSVVDVAPNRRPMSMVFQSYALFPHLNVTDNVGFGLTARHATKKEKGERVQRVMEMMGILEYAQRYPHELSGGQQQRVALARALVMEPSILLFDEPLSNLDAKLRLRMREEIRAVQQRLGITSVFVTHDQSEAMTMSDVVVVMRDGRIQQVGTPEDIYHRPTSMFVASFLGTANFVPADILDLRDDDRTGRRMAHVRIGDTIAEVACDTLAARDQDGQVLIRSENLHVLPEGTGIEHQISGTVITASFDGAITRYSLQTPFGVLQGQSSGTEQRLPVGTQVSCVYDPVDLWLITS